VVDGVTASERNSIGSTLNLTAQTLLEGARVQAAGKLPLALDGIKQTAFREWVTKDVGAKAKRAATIDLARGDRHEGGPDNRLVEIVSPGLAAEVQVRQSALTDELFGADDRFNTIEHDEALLAVSRRAKQAVLALKPRYHEQAPEGEELLVKAP